MAIPPASIRSQGSIPVVRKETNICEVAGDETSATDPKTGLMELPSDGVKDVFDYAAHPITQGTGAKAKTNLIGNGDSTLTKAELQQVIAQSQKELSQAKDPGTKAEIRVRIGSAAQLLKNFDRFTNNGTGLRFADIQTVRDRCKIPPSLPNLDEPPSNVKKAPPLPDLGLDTNIQPLSDWRL